MYAEYIDICFVSISTLKYTFQKYYSKKEQKSKEIRIILSMKIYIHASLMMDNL